jgi:hypothetical protein
LTDLSPETALAIIASHGADPARWPADACAAVLAMAQHDDDVAAALDAARALDADLAGWLAAGPALAAVDVAAITAQPRHAVAAPRRWSGWRPMLLAASLTMMLATFGWLAMPGQEPAQPAPMASIQPPSAGIEAAEADLAFAYVFTPTAAEEDLI